MKKYLFLILALTATFISKGQSNSPKVSEKVAKEIEILKNSDLKLNENQLYRITTVLVGEEQKLTRIQAMLAGNKIQLEQNLIEYKKHKILNIKGAMTDLQKEKFDEAKMEQKF